MMACTDRPRCPDGRMQMCEQTGTGIHLHDCSGLFLQGAADVLSDDVEPRDVEADHAGRLDRPRRHVPVHAIGDVLGQIAVALDEHPAAWRRAGLRLKSFLLQGQERFRIDLDLGQRRIAVVAASHIAVQLPFDQLSDRVVAIANHAGVVAAGRGDHPFADHEQAVFEAGDELFDEDGIFPAMSLRESYTRP